jgi:ribonucleoside-diphosphate reductase alpha chain
MTRPWEERFYEALEDFRYLPAGRITAGAGTGRNVTLFNCFVMGTIPDSMGGIFEALKEAALTMQQGGGIGYDFSTIRPKGADGEGRGGGCLGAAQLHGCLGRDVPHDHVGGLAARRDDGHDALRPPRYRGFHRRQGRPAPAHVQHVGAGDRSVHGGGEGRRPVGADLRRQVYKTVQARDLWNRIMRATYDYAEPGVIFIDRINARTTSAIAKPSRHQPLRRTAAAALWRLPAGVGQPRAAGGDAVRGGALTSTRRAGRSGATAMRMMDNVVDASRFPLEAQAQEAQAKRRIGLGVTGLADALLMLGLRYGSDEAARRPSEWMAASPAAYLASVDREGKGAFPLFDATAYARPR